MSILSKDTILKHIVPFLPVAKRGKKLTESQQIGVIEAIFYRLKTGCQWRQLPLKCFFDKPYSHKTVFYHFNEWNKQGVWKNIWLGLLKAYKNHLDMSRVQLDGSHTRCYKAQEAVAFQTRKADQTTNLLFLSDNQGVLVAVSEPISGQHHDLFEIQTHFNQLLEILQAADIAIEGLFLNADSGFDSQSLRTRCKKKALWPILLLTHAMAVGGTGRSILMKHFTEDALRLNGLLPCWMDLKRSWFATKPPFETGRV